MAYAMTKQGSLDNCITYEFICDALEDMNAIENRYRTIGSIAVVLQGESGGMEAYIAGSNKQWNNLGAMGASGSNSESTGSGLSIYICAQNEVSNGLPNIQDPDETTIYLVSAGNESGNLYEEYIYVNSAWEKFGAASIDISGKADKADTVLTTTLSRGRKANTTVGIASFAFGYDITASGDYSHAEGKDTGASGTASHAEGNTSEASGYASHAEGDTTKAYRRGSHAEGSATTANGDYSHSEGKSTITSGEASHAEGHGTTASAQNSHSEGSLTTASGVAAHAEGYGGTYTLNNVTYTSRAVGMSDHTEGYQCLTASGQPGNHAEGYQTRATGGAAHSEGASTAAQGNASHAEGSATIATGFAAHTEGYMTNATEQYSHAEGTVTTASGAFSHAEGAGTHATAAGAHAEGQTTTASGENSHTEGGGTTASGVNSHAEGASTNASGVNSHAEGASTVASGAQSHAEGASAIASGLRSHAEGCDTIASGTDSHVGGAYNIADSYDNWNEWVANASYKVGDKVKVTTTNNDVTTVTGYVCKTANSDSTFISSKWTNQDGKMNFVEIIGNGNDSNHSNARALDWDGNEYLKGNLYVGCNGNSTGGTKVTPLPAAPSTDGNYILKVNVSSGIATYSWVALSDLSGVTF